MTWGGCTLVCLRHTGPIALIVHHASRHTHKIFGMRSHICTEDVCGWKDANGQKHLVCEALSPSKSPGTNVAQPHRCFGNSLEGHWEKDDKIRNPRFGDAELLTIGEFCLLQQSSWQFPLWRQRQNLAHFPACSSYSFEMCSQLYFCRNIGEHVLLFLLFLNTLFSWHCSSCGFTLSHGGIHQQRNEAFLFRHGSAENPNKVSLSDIPRFLLLSREDILLRILWETRCCKWIIVPFGGSGVKGLRDVVQLCGSARLKQSSDFNQSLKNTFTVETCAPTVEVVVCTCCRWPRSNLQLNIWPLWANKNHFWGLPSLLPGTSGDTLWGLSLSEESDGLKSNRTNHFQ